MRTNPVASADFRASFSHAGALHVWAIFLGALAVVLFAWWPRSDLAWHLRTATPPGTFAAVAIALFLLAGYLNARAGDGEYAPAEETTLTDLVALTPVPVAAVVAGRLAAGAITVLFQLLLGLPFLLAALGVSGVSASVLPAVAAVVASAAMAWRASGLALRLALPEHPVLRDVLLLAASTSTSQPRSSPSRRPTPSLRSWTSPGGRPHPLGGRCIAALFRRFGYHRTAGIRPRRCCIIGGAAGGEEKGEGRQCSQARWGGTAGLNTSTSCGASPVGPVSRSCCAGSCPVRSPAWQRGSSTLPSGRSCRRHSPSFIPSWCPGSSSRPAAWREPLVGCAVRIGRRGARRPGGPVARHARARVGGARGGRGPPVQRVRGSPAGGCRCPGCGARDRGASSERRACACCRGRWPPQPW